MAVTLPHQVVTLSLPRDCVQDEECLLAREWLVTNGLGGYASSTLLCAPTRRYHGLFVPDLPSPWGRTVMIPRLDEVVLADAGSVYLSGVEFEDGRVDGDLPAVLQEFVRHGQTPVWRYHVAGRRVEKRVLMPYGHNSVYVEYRLLEGNPVHIHVRPFVTFRMLDAALHEAKQPPFPLTAVEGRYEMQLCDGAPPLKLCLRPSCGLFVADARLSHGVCYRLDRDRGSEHLENLSSPGYFQADVTREQPVAFVASTEPWEHLECRSEALFEAEAQRIGKLLHTVRAAGADETEERLALAADQFIVAPGSRVEEQALARASGDQARTVIAGYHWFTDWGRDTMISLEGLTLCTGRYQEARSILKTFAGYVQDGLLPNLFPEGERQGLYHTADATLWYFHALDRYYRVTGDRDLLIELQPVLRSILDHHVRGTRFGIGVDRRDGLLRAAADGYQLTWMDAKVEGWVVTPRRGKPVEIQALWYNALRCIAEWGCLSGRPESEWAELAEQARESFNRRFWYEPGGYLYDVVDGEPGDDPAFRPNQLLSIALPHPVLDEQRWQEVVEVVAEKLLTPVGLRSLSREHSEYKSKYFGDLRARDAAYHQGTVWAWLIGPFIDAWLKVSSDPAQARSLLEGFQRHLLEGGIGTISEIFDAEPPYHPRGCIAQAWSVAEVLRAWQKTRGPSA
ncbi:amylo-alpha-1,6-glucosidase [Nitrospira defluvii]|uniref:Glycogen debranching enzyme-related protein n=1 Tax=Nitrospira defluvii TaxID=330214 RepID=A0ABM8R162_9BACT|nr:amylo-alpha-1,6-glucosidase [Nitrospira defluvii]CAE6727390.1 glycogen debranching enzyme-related protein [Nitrospira defluvii]